MVLAGDHIYKMNYALMLADHVAKGRQCTVGCIEVPRAEASAFGVMAVDDELADHRLRREAGRPAGDAGQPDAVSLASMGIYVFDAKYLYDELARDMADPNSSHDFGKDIIPNAVRNGCAAAHPFGLSCVSRKPGEEPYWRDVGTIDAYWDANIDLTATVPLLNLYDTQLADLDLPAAAAAGQVRAQPGRPARHGDRVDGLGRLHHLRARVPLGAVLQRAGALVFQRQLVGAAARGARWAAMRG